MSNTHVDVLKVGEAVARADAMECIDGVPELEAARNDFVFNTRLSWIFSRMQQAINRAERESFTISLGACRRQTARTC